MPKKSKANEALNFYKFDKFNKGWAVMDVIQNDMGKNEIMQ